MELSPIILFQVIVFLAFAYEEPVMVLYKVTLLALISPE